MYIHGDESMKTCHNQNKKCIEVIKTNENDTQSKSKVFQKHENI